MIYVYRKQSSAGARALSRTIPQARRVFNMDQVNPRAGDLVLCWGSSYQPRNGEFVLNGTQVRNKLTDAQVLQRANVPTIQVSQTRPPDRPAQPAIDPAIDLFENAKECCEEFSEIRLFQRGQPLLAAVTEVGTALAELSQALQAPAPVAGPAEIWLPRMNDHVGGGDLLTPPQRPDFFVRKEDIRQEFRVHSFDGRSIRAGVKRVREGFHGEGRAAVRGSMEAHPWIRSYDGGWFIDYTDFESSRQMRELAAQAVQALGLDFGAVDIGQKADGSLIVLEVNRAPGLEGGTIEAYVTAINRWLQED